MSTVTLVGGQVLMGVHSPAKCVGRPCCIHSPSGHHMRAWPQNWRQDRGLMERLCPHGIGHPDPDDYRLQLGVEDGVHGCDGCCVRLDRAGMGAR